jgi:hypothetical protein
MVSTESPTISSALLPKLTVGNACSLLFAYIVYRALYQVIYYHFFHPLAKFPGPFWGGVTRIWIAYHNIKEDECAVFTELTKKYGMCGIMSL